VNCLNKGCHTLFIQCSNCTGKYEGCCSIACQDVIQLSEEEQKKHREGKHANAKIYKKGRSPHIKHKTLHNPLKEALKKFRD